MTNQGERTVLIDMDGVMADFEEPNNAIIREHFPYVEPIIHREDFYFADTYRDYTGLGAKIYTENRRPGFFRDFPVVDGAIQGWQRIVDAGYTPRVCSSPLEGHATVITEKLDWLTEHFVPIFGSWVVETAIFDRDKSGYDAIAMIDDRPTARNAARAAWQHIIFTQSYNRLVQSDFRLASWHDVNLEDLLRRAQQAYRRSST